MCISLLDYFTFRSYSLDTRPWLPLSTCFDVSSLPFPIASFLIVECLVRINEKIIGQNIHRLDCGSDLRFLNEYFGLSQVDSDGPS